MVSPPKDTSRALIMGSDERMETEDFLDRIGFDPETSVLTHRQAEILLLREWGHSQAAIADRLGTTRANVTNIEASARANVEKARETLRVIDAMEAPVQVTIPPGTDIFDVPDRVYEACNDVDIKVAYTAPDLMKRVRDDAEDVIHEQTVEAQLTISVNVDGELQIRRGNATLE